jgi:thioredoxin reductase
MPCLVVAGQRTGGFIGIEEDSGATSLEGVLTAGDVVGGTLTLAPAIATGLQAATAIDRHLLPLADPDSIQAY